MIRIDCILPDGRLQKTIELEDGKTISDAALALHPETEGKFPVPVIAIVGDAPAVRGLGDWDLPLAATQVQFREIAMGGGGGGGGSNPLQMVMQIAIVALAALATWYIGGLGGTFLGIGMTFWGGLAGAGILMLGTLLMGALFQQNVPSGQMGQLDAAQSSPTYSINASGNQARLYQPEPEGFGRMKVVPDYVAKTWMQYIDNDQYGYFVYGIGRGHYRYESLQFGETVFWRNGALVSGTGYEIQDIQFVEPGQAVTIFPDNVESSDEVSGQELFAPNDEQYTGALGPYVANSAGTQTDKILLDFVFQRGIGQYDNQGRMKYYTVSWIAEYRRIDDVGAPLSGWATLEHCSFGGATLTPQRITKTYRVAKGRYEVRCRRTSNTDAGDGRTMDSLAWGALRAMLPGTLTYPISCVAFSVKASNALTQSASRQFSAIVTRKLPLYNRQTKTWSAETPTRSWAAAISHVCKSEWGGRITDANIDLDTLWAIDERLAAKNWYYDAYIDSAYLVWNLICEMCQSQCVLPRFVGPILSFVEDAPNRPPSFALTPRNIVRNTFSVTYATWSEETPDDVNVEYLDAAYGFQQRDVTAKLPESESKEPANLSILGITNRSHAHKVAVAYAAHNRWQRIIVECRVEALGRIINRGDICTVAHPRFKNTAAGAVSSWDESTLEIKLIQDMSNLVPSPYEPGDTLYIAFTKQDGTIWGPCRLERIRNKVAKLASGDYSNLLLQGMGNPFEWMTSGSDRLPTAWTLYTGKTYQRLMVVESVTTEDMLHYNLRLSNYDERIYQYGNLPVPPWQGRQQLPSPDAPLAAPKDFYGVVQSQTSVVLVWSTTVGASWYEVETSIDGQSWISMGRVNINQLDVSTPSGTFYARVRAANESKQSPWSPIWSTDTSIPRPDAPTLTITQAYSGATGKVSWPAEALATHYIVSLSTSAGGESFYTAQISSTFFEVTPEIQQGGPYRSLVVSVVAVGTQGSSAPSTITLSDPAPPAVEDATVEVLPTLARIMAVQPPLPADGTGYVFARGETVDFGINQVSDARLVSSLPYSWVGLTPGVNYFRMAMRDAFFDVNRNLLALNWSEVLAVTIPAPPAGD